MKIVSRIAFCIASAALAAAPPPAAAQGFPVKPVRIVVAFPPGAIDLYVRLMQPHMQDDLGQPIVVENRVGANGFIGAEHVARSAPDGYTLLATSGGSLVVGTLVSGNPPFETLKHFEPVTMIYTSPTALVAKSSLPVNSFRELVDYAKRNPGKLSYGSVGIGSSQHVDGETFKRTAGLDLIHVPYKGFGPVVQALLGQEVDLAFASVGIVKQLIMAGKVKLLAVHNGRLPADMPGVPNLNETMPGWASAPAFIGLWAPAGTPRPVLARLNSAAVKSLQAPSVRAKIEEGGAVVVADSPEEFLAKIRASFESMARTIKAAKDAGVRFE